MVQTDVEEQISIFDVLAYETKENKFKAVTRHIECREMHMRIICECLNIAKEELENCTSANTSSEVVINRKLRQIVEVIKIIEVGAGYDFQNQLEKCRKKEHIGDVGEEAMLISANRKGKDK